ncbi:MAG: DUF2461 domain-containing protein [Flavobacteriales bacterium]
MENALSFLEQLTLNNNREWFTAHKQEFDAARHCVLDLTQQLIDNVSTFDSDIKGLQANKCVFRIYRDTRFSKNKLPYKNNMGAYFAKGDKRLQYAGYYLHLQPGESFLAAGVFMPESRLLKAIRQEIYFNSESLLNILVSSGFKKYYTQLDDYKLKTLPKGYDKNHAAIELLRYTSFVASHPLTNDQLCAADFLDHATNAFKAIVPLVRWLNHAIDQAE